MTSAWFPVSRILFMLLKTVRSCVAVDQLCKNPFSKFVNLGRMKSIIRLYTQLSSALEITGRREIGL